MAARTVGTRLSPLLAAARSPAVLRLRPLVAAGDGLLRRSAPPAARGGPLRSFSSRPTTSSLNDPSPNWSNRPPKETILLDGCDFEHWLVVMEPPDQNATRDEIIDSYIKTLAQVVGSEEEARMKIYSVSTKHYFAFGALVSEELSYKIKSLPRVRWVLPDSYLDVKNKDYGGEPFINGEAVPYDPKYHEEWVRNNARANDRSRRTDRPRNFDRSRNFERRRENMQQNQGFQSNSTSPLPPLQNSPPPPMNNQFNPVPNANTAPPQQPPPNAGYRNPAPNNTYQGGPQVYPGQAGGPVYQGQGGPQPYPGQAGGPAYQGQGGYHGGNSGYQGGNPGYQSGNPGSYQGANRGYQGGPPPPPQGGNNYQGGVVNPNPSYQGGGYQGYQGGVNPNPSYQEGPYQGGNNPTSYQGGNTTNYQGGNQGYQPARDVPGRD